MAISQVQKNFGQKKNQGIPPCFNESRTECPKAEKKFMRTFDHHSYQKIVLSQKKIRASYPALEKAGQNAQ